MQFRQAVKEDVPAIVQLLADDELGQLREDYQNPLPQTYYQAFTSIANDPNQEVIVVESDTNEIIGTLQLSFIQYLTYQGGIRAQIEAVRIHKDHRSEGLGKNFFFGQSGGPKKKGHTSYN